MKRMLLSALLGIVLACIMPAALASGINNYFIIPSRQRHASAHGGRAVGLAI